MVLPAQEDKNLEENSRESDKKIGLNLDRSKRERKCLWKVLNSEEHMKNLSFKNSLNDFWLIEKQVWSIENYLRLIQHQSSQADSNQILNRNFNWLSNRFDWSKIWKNQIFEKQSILMQKLLKTQYFMNKMPDYKMKSFSKTLEFNPNLQKSRFSINLSPNLKL